MLNLTNFKLATALNITKIHNPKELTNSLKP